MPARLRGVLASAALLAGTPACAHFTERTDSLWGFVRRAELVATGRVLGARRVTERGHTIAPGALRLRVETVLAGGPPATWSRGEGGDAPDADILVRTGGPHQPAYADGERVLVFCERRDGALVSLQSRDEKIVIQAETAPVIAAVRRYVDVERTPAPRRAGRLKAVTLAMLRSPVPRLHGDATFDLNRPGTLDAVLGDHDLDALGALAETETAPLVVREGVAAKLGALARAGRAGAVPPLVRLAERAVNPAVRVAALGALARSRHSAALPVLARAATAPDRFVRFAAVDGLGRLASPDAVAPLASRLDDRDPRVRFAAVKALARTDAPAARAALENVDPTLRAQATAQAAPLLRRPADGRRPVP
jgi:hypothetical protein